MIPGPGIGLLTTAGWTALDRELYQGLPGNDGVRTLWPSTGGLQRPCARHRVGFYEARL